MVDQFDELGLYDIYGIWYIPWWQTKTFYISCVIFTIVLLLIGVWFFIRRLKKNVIAIPIWQQTLQELQGIKQNNYLTVIRGKEFYFKVTEILKKYLAIRYQLNIAGKTDSQLIKYLQEVKFPSELINEIESIFMGGLTIKFANAQAAQKKIEEDFAASILFIEKTIPQEKSH